MTEPEKISAEDKAKLDSAYADIEKYFKDHNVHDICLKTMAMLLESDGVTWREQWTPEIAAAWWVELESAKNARTHKKAVDDLIMLALYFDRRLNKKNVSLGLLILLNEAVVRYQLVDVNIDAQFDKQVHEAEPKVTGVKDRPMPAKVGDKAPAGAVRPDQLGKGPRRI